LKIQLHTAVVAALLAMAGCSRAPSSAGEAAPATVVDAAAPVEQVAPDTTPPVAVQSAEYPQLDVATIDGGRYVLSAQRGKWVVVNFWATWCAPCIKEMPELSAMHSLRSNVEVVGLAYEDTTAQELTAFLAQRPVTYPIAIADPYAPPADFATPRGLPMTFLIDPAGKLAHQFLGPVTASEIEQMITAAGGTP
jgi:thiol-disulfide isomerase/thioredoxin